MLRRSTIAASMRGDNHNRQSSVRGLVRRSVGAVAIASAIAVAVPAVAQAASKPTANITLASSSIAAGSTARLSYSTAGLPAGSAVYLQERTVGPGQGWSTDKRLARNGSISGTSSPAGHYAFRLIVQRAGHQILTSRAAYLTVRPAASHHSSTSSTLWSWVKDAVKWGAYLVCWLWLC